MTLPALDSARLSGPGLRTYDRIADEWSLGPEQRADILGVMPDQYAVWVARASRREDLELPEEALVRFSAVLSIYRQMRTIFLDDDQSVAWMTRPHRGQEFGGRAPLDLLVDDGRDGIDVVLSYLLAWAAGNLPAHAAEGTYEPVTEDDLVWIDGDQ